MPLFYVKIRKNIDICNYLPIYYPAICRGWGTFSVPSQGAGAHLSQCLRWLCGTPSPRGGSPFLLCFRRLGGTPSLWGGLGRGFRVVGEGLSALATPTELPLLVLASLRTLTRSGRATISPILTISTKRKECSLTALNTVRRNSFPLGKAGKGLSFDALPLGRVGVGLSFY